MINFIICENDENFIEEIMSVIEKFIFKTKYKYKVYVYKEYNDELDKLIKKNIGIKIYILDIELDNDTSGLNVAKAIRVFGDWDSIIIFNTAYSEKYYQKLLAGKFGFLEVINKDNSYQEHLADSFDYALKYKDCTKAVVFNTKDILYRFFTSDILYIYVFDRKSIIVTSYTKITVTESLASIHSKLDWRFQYSHKSCIVNIEKINKIYKNKRIICFEDINLELVSYKYLKIIMSLLRENNIDYILITQ